MTPARPYRRVLVGVDFSSPSREAYRHGLALARQLDARLEVVHVVPKLKPSIPFSAANRRVVAQLQKTSVTDAEDRLERLVRRATIPVQTAVLRGKPSERILAHATRRKADLIVVAQQGQNLAEHLLIGSTAERVSRHAKVPVVLVPVG